MSIDHLERRWDFVPSDIPGWLHRMRLRSLARNVCTKPRCVEIVAAAARPEWVAYFVYLPDGNLTAAHRYTLKRLRDLEIPILVVCATREPARVPEELRRFAQALYWKELHGYDFSAYAVAASVLAEKSPGSSVMFLNDSIFGPFVDLREQAFYSPWDFTGFTASAMVENHVQSYAFVIKDVSPGRLQGLWPVFFPFFALRHRDAAILCQETRLARVAFAHMSVGAHWYGRGEGVTNPVLEEPFSLLQAGFPFMKKSLLGKQAHFNKNDAASAFLEKNSHPIEGR